jgi:predicted DNA binding CopG/RHH family protein
VEEKMKHLPTTDSISELAAFWQVNDLTDFEDELVEISEPVFQRAEQVSIRLASEDISALRRRARREHLSEADLISRWVHERLSGKENSTTNR